MWSRWRASWAGEIRGVQIDVGADQISVSAVLRSLEFILTAKRSHQMLLSFLGLL